MVLFLIVHTMCDLCCKDCFYSKGYEKRDSNKLELKDIELFVQKIYDLKFETIILTGGDPLYSKRKNVTYALVECLKKRNIKVIINTSGANLTYNDIQILINLRVDRIDFSINSVDEKLNNAERGKYQDTVFAITNLLDSGYKKISTTTVITEENSFKVLETLQWLKLLGVEDVRYQPVFKQGEQNYSLLRKTMLGCNKLFGKEHSNNFLLQCDKAYNEEKPHNKSICMMGKEIFVSDALGNIYPCFHRFDVKLGNIFDDDIELLRDKLKNNNFYSKKHNCFGKHCVSLFDNGIFWEKKKKYEKECLSIPNLYE